MYVYVILVMVCFFQMDVSIEHTINFTLMCLFVDRLSRNHFWSDEL